MNPADLGVGALILLSGFLSMAEENRAQAALCDTDDYREGFAAFQEKRRPQFTGRG